MKTRKYMLIMMASGRHHRLDLPDSDASPDDLARDFARKLNDPDALGKALRVNSVVLLTRYIESIEYREELLDV